MAYNTVEEIKEKLLLESENQTLSDSQIQTYLNDANRDMISELKRAIEVDRFVAEVRGTNIFYPIFNTVEVISIKVNNVELDSDEYRLVYFNDGIEILSLDVGDQVEYLSIPPNYKVLEMAFTIVAIKTRLNPFKNNTVDPIYNEWNEKKTNALKVLRSKFGADSYNG